MGAKYRLRAREFLACLQAKRRSSSSSSPLDKQVEVYRYAVCQEPPSEEYADYLAANGKTIIPVVLDRLEARPDQLRKAPLVLVLVVLHKNYYRLGDQADLIARLNADVASIQDPSDRSEAEDYLRRIESSPGVGAM